MLGLCLPTQAVPRLVRDDDGLRRSPPLPRALREPLSPGLPGEVQGIAARRPLVAPQPARAARRLPRRLRADLPRTRRSRTTRCTCSPGLACWIFFSVSLQSASRSMVDSAELIKKVRFPRQLVAFSMVATQAVTFGVMLVILIVLSLVFVPEARATVWARDPAGRRLRRARRRARAARRVPERALPRHRARAHGGAPAVVLPDADPLERRARCPTRRSAITRCSTVLRWGNPIAPPDRGGSRRDLARARCLAPPT